MSFVAPLLLPGVIMHELSHVVMCHLRNSKVVEVCYFRSIFHASGYVKHVKTYKISDSFLIGCSPFIFLIPLSIILFTIANILWNTNILMSIILYWLAISLSIGAIPSGNDINTIYNCISDNKRANETVVSYFRYVQFIDVMCSLFRMIHSLTFISIIYMVSIAICQITL